MQFCPHFPKTRPLGAVLGLLLLVCSSLFVPAHAQVSVLTQNNDNARTGANLAETTLTPANVTSSTFGKVLTISGLDANVNGQVLYAAGVSLNGATHNVLYVYTSNNTDNSPSSLYALDADTGATLWHTPFPALSATYTTCTPVIDPATGIVYVLTKSSNDDTGVTYLHAFNMTTGQEEPGSPVHVTASAPGTGDGNVNGVVSFDGPASSGRFHANDRAALLLLNGVVYTAYAHNSDSYPYHGWVLAYKYDGTKFTQTASFCTTPNGGDGGIWMAGKGLTADNNGYIYCSVGNGTFDANAGGPDYGMCYLKLRASDLSVADWFSPFDEQAQSNQDLDTGNSGLVGIPGTTRLFGGATKFGTGFLLDSTNMGHFTPGGPDKAVLRLNNLTPNDSVGQNPICWDASSSKYVYLWANGAPVEQFSYNAGTGTFTPAGIYKQATSLTQGGSLAVSASGASNGILWAVGYDNVVRAFDATDVSKPLLWSSAQNSSRDGLGSVGHFQFPTVVNGKVYVPTGSRSIVVYGLLTAPPAVQNGSFETPVVGAPGQFGSFQYNPTGGAWTFTGSAGIAANVSGFTYGNPSAPDGTQVAFLQGTGSASQAVTFAAGTYTLSAAAAQRGNINQSGEDFRVLVDGNVVGTFKPTGTTYSTVTTSSFTVGAGIHTVTFQGMNTAGGDNTIFLDSVKIAVAPTPPAVVLNNSFETPEVGAPGQFGSFQYNPTGGAWTFTGSAGIAANVSGFTYGNPSAPDGVQVAFLQGTGSASQAVTFAAGTYTLSAAAAQRGNINQSGEDFRVLVDGNVVGTFKPTGTAYSTVTTGSFTVTAGSHTVTLQGVDTAGGDNTVFLDKIAIGM